MIGGTRSAAICLRNRCGLSGSHCQWAPTPVQMLVSLRELIEPLRVVAGDFQSPQFSACAAHQERAASEHVARALQAASDDTTRLQWFVLNPLEELGVRQRARLVLDEGD